MSFGAYVSGIMFQTLSFVTFVLISHGYCITCARLPVTEQRRTAVLALFFYLALVGYKTGLPYCNVSPFVFTIFELGSNLNFFILFLVLKCYIILFFLNREDLNFTTLL